MIPEVGATGKFAFTARFATLDGVFRIRAETTFEDALASGIDFVSSLYNPAGLSSTDFDADYATYQKDRVAVLQSVVDTNLVYNVPESVFLTIPDTTIKEYISINLVAKLGVFSNTQVLLPMLDEVKNLLQSSIGSTDPIRLIANAQNKVYLTDDEYAMVQSARDAFIQELVPLSVQLHNAQTTITAQAAKIAAYEALIAQTSVAGN